MADEEGRQRRKCLEDKPAQRELCARVYTSRHEFYWHEFYWHERKGTQKGNEWPTTTRRAVGSVIKRSK